MLSALLGALGMGGAEAAATLGAEAGATAGAEAAGTGSGFLGGIGSKAAGTLGSLLGVGKGPFTVTGFNGGRFGAEDKQADGEKSEGNGIAQLGQSLGQLLGSQSAPTKGGYVQPNVQTTPQTVSFDWQRRNPFAPTSGRK